MKNLLAIIVGMLLLLATPVLGAVSVDITSPTNGQAFYGSSVPLISFSVTLINDTSMNACWFSLNNGGTNYTFSCDTKTGAFTPAIFGIYTLQTYAQDSLSNVATDSVTFRITESNTPSIIPNQNITDIGSALSVPNNSTGGYFWFVMVLLIVLVMMITMMPFGWEISALSSFFAGIVLSLILLYMDLVAIKWVGVFVGAELMLFLYIVWSSNRDQ